MRDDDPAYQALLKEYRLGQQAREFLNSEVGVYLRQRARQDYEDAKQKLLACSPDTWWGRRKIRRFQRDAAIAESVTRYLADVITNGELALQQLQYEYET